jgi:ABC-2 type transport system permease protein
MRLHLVVNEARLQWYEMRQYWFETVSGLLFICAIFLGLFYGIKSFVVPEGEEQTLDGLLFGFLLWTFASGAYGSITKSIIEDTQRGYIEHLFLCPQGVVQLLLSRAMADMLMNFVTLVLVAYVVMALTGNWLSINFLYFYGLLMLAAPSLVGLGLMISGFALVFKKVETVGAMLTLGLMGLVALDGLPVSPLTLLPFVPGASLTREVILHNAAMNYQHLVIVLVNSAAYLSVGWWVFNVCAKAAKKRNLIGQY